MQKRICPQCGSVTRPKREARGTVALELALWLVTLIVVVIFWLALPLLLVPFAYSFYRVTAKRLECRTCGAADPVPMDSPRGKALIREYGWEPKDAPKIKPPKPTAPKPAAKPTPAPKPGEPSLAARRTAAHRRRSKIVR